MNTKKELRKEFFRKRNTLTEKYHQKYSKIITKKLISLKQYVQADMILIYASYQKEVSTYGIIGDALNRGKRVFCPKVLSHGIMEFYEITSLKDIVPGYKNIPEPRREDSMFSFSDDNTGNTLMIMPLVGFDALGNRLGYGGGFYDRYLQRFPQLKRIGLGFECQKYEYLIPTEKTDIKPDLIITEVNILITQQIS